MRIELASIFGSTERRKKQSQQRKKSLSQSFFGLCRTTTPTIRKQEKLFWSKYRLPSANRVTYHLSCVLFSHCRSYFSPVLSSHIAHMDLIVRLCVCVCFGYAFSFQLCLAQIITLSRMNNVCTKAWIWIFRGQKNTCSIVQFILHSWLNDCFYMKENICGLFVRFEYTRRLFHSFLGEYVNFHAF